MSSPHPLHNQSPHASPHGQEIYRKQKWLRPVLSAAQGGSILNKTLNNLWDM